MRTAILALFLLPYLPVFGQMMNMEDPGDARWEAQVYFDMAVPLGDLADNMSTVGIGVGGEALYHVQGPAWVGLGMQSYRFDNRKITYLEQFDNENFEVDELTASRSIAAQVIARFQPELNSIFSPYIQGGIGWHWFYTNTKIKDIENDETIDQFSEYSDSDLGIAIQAGVQISPDAMQALSIDLRVGYFQNGQIEYMRYNPDIIVSQGAFPVESFEVVLSTVQFIGLQLGLAVRF